MFLNRVGFNGIYRENGLGLYNVPWSKKETVSIYSMESLSEANRLLNSLDKVVLCCGDFQKTGYFVTQNNTFVYFDPPYRPISASSFVNYVNSPFNDDSQIRLKKFCDEISSKYGAKVMVSNSYDPGDDFLIKLYKNYNIEQITAVRSSGGKNAMRGKIQENLIRNYETKNS